MAIGWNQGSFCGGIMKTKKLSLLALLLVLVVACTTLTVTKSAETLAAFGNQFLDTAAQIDAAYSAKKIPEADYDRWRKFVPGFRQSFAEAEKALVTLRAAGVVATPEQQAELVRSFKNQLLNVVLQVYAPAAKGVQ